MANTTPSRTWFSRNQRPLTTTPRMSLRRVADPNNARVFGRPIRDSRIFFCRFGVVAVVVVVVVGPSLVLVVSMRELTQSLQGKKQCFSLVCVCHMLALPRYEDIEQFHFEFREDAVEGHA